MSVNSFENYPMSWRPVLAGRRQAKYVELARQLEDDILSGRLSPGVKLPPQRELADYLGIDFTTVTRAYDACRAKGLVYGVVGRGTFVASEIAAGPQRTVIDLGVVEAFPEAGSAAIIRAAGRVLACGDAARLFDYSARDGRGHPRDAAQRWFAAAGLRVREDNVAVFPGTQSALSVALLSLFAPGDRIAVDVFTYANLISLAYLAHVRLVPIAGDASGMRADALAESAAKDALKGVFLMPVEANPTGRTMPLKRRRELAAVCEAADLIILEDSAALWPDQRKTRSLFALCPGRTLHLVGVSRFLAPGLRVAFVAFPEAFKARLLNGLHHLVIKASALEAEILAELVLSGEDGRILAEKRRRMTEANALYDGLFGTKGTGFFRTLPLPGTKGRGEAIEAELLRRGVKVCHSDRFAVGKTEDAFLRLSLSSERDFARLRRGLEIVREWKLLTGDGL